MSETYQSLSHSKWDCKYHVVFVPERRRKAIFGQTRRQLGAIFHSLAKQKECQIMEGHLMPDHVHNVHRNSTQAPSRVGDRVSEGEERHRRRPPVRQGTKLHGRASLGSRLCRINRRVRIGAGPPHTSASKMRMEQADNSELTNKARSARRLDQMTNRL